jgi:deoxycytidine triphosphate deaminase
MTLLNDKQIARLAEKDIFLPYVGEKRRTLDNGTKAISFGLSQAGYDIRLSSVEFLVFTMDQWDGGTYELDVKNFDVEPTATELVEQQTVRAFSFYLPTVMALAPALS